MNFHTVVCGTCGWSYGPTNKKVIKEMLRHHKEVHRLERLVNETKETSHD
jgi:uncharacterized protein YecE (DUF72 family)